MMRSIRILLLLTIVTPIFTEVHLHFQHFDRKYPSIYCHHHHHHHYHHLVALDDHYLEQCPGGGEPPPLDLPLLPPAYMAQMMMNLPVDLDDIFQFWWEGALS